MINKRLKKLRDLMIKRDIDAYIIPTSDPHQSEYIADFYKTREYISGFTGSAGTAVVTMDKAILWTDGRYFVQAEQELKYSEFELYKMGNPEFPNINEFLVENVKANGKIGFCGDTFSYQSYRDILKSTGTRLLITTVDFIGDIWEDRPSLPSDKVFVHEQEYSGTTPKERIEKLRKDMQKNGIDYYLVSAVDEVCYLYSIRGNDVECNPVALAYGLVSQKDAIIYIDENKVDEEVQKHFKDNSISMKAYNDISEDLSNIEGKNTIFFDPRTVNISLINNIKSNVTAIKEASIVEQHKAIKNDVEIKNQKNAYIKDGVALVKYFSWLETGVPTGVVTEVLASNKLLNLRQEQELFIEDSFETISAYGANAAMPHYSPGLKGEVLKAKGLYLCDSGGQYLDGTTDITRTIALGELTDDEKYHYTMVLKSHIALASAYFKEGTTGYYLDAFAKYPLLKEKLDFNHGTGHGVGYFLNVHEGPQSISGRYKPVTMKPGMVTSIEPGLYIEGSHGIRIENIAVVVEAGENEFGKFLGFEVLSYVPIDTRPVDLTLLTEDEIKWLNDYNKACYDKLNLYLDGEELDYLKKVTEGVSK